MPMQYLKFGYLNAFCFSSHLLFLNLLKPTGYVIHHQDLHSTTVRSVLTDQGSTVDFILYPHLKSIKKGARFADVAAIQERVTAVLRSIPK
jgi:hypothetical protein